jgi:hypothetical protein
MLSPTVLSHRISLSIFMMLNLTYVECGECSHRVIKLKKKEFQDIK